MTDVLNDLQGFAGLLDIDSVNGKPGHSYFTLAAGVSGPRADIETFRRAVQAAADAARREVRDAIDAVPAPADLGADVERLERAVGDHQTALRAAQDKLTAARADGERAARLSDADTLADADEREDAAERELARVGRRLPGLERDLEAAVKTRDQARRAARLAAKGELLRAAKGGLDAVLAELGEAVRPFFAKVAASRAAVEALTGRDDL